MYGRRRYGRKREQGDDSTPIPPEAIPTFLCPRCNKAKSTGTDFIELTAVDKDGLLLHNKICGDCSKSLQDWIKGK